jgi:hypothetical protein
MPTKRESQPSELRKLEFMFTLDETPAMTAAIKSIATLIAFPQKKDYLVCGYLVPSAGDQYCLWFHIDQTDADKRAKCFFCHMVFSVTFADKTRDISASESRKQGATIESFLRDLSSASSGKAADVFADAELRLKGPQRVPSSLSSKPLHADSATLEICGAEYRSSAKTTGLREFRWSDRAKKHRTVWLHYKTSWNWSQPWDQEHERCMGYIKDLL